MATAIQSFHITARRSVYRTTSQVQSTRPFERRRCFKTVSARRVDDVGKDLGSETRSPDNEDSNQPAILPPDVQVLDKEFEDILKKYGRIRQNMPEELRNLPTFREVRPKKPKAGALNMGVPASEMPEEDPEFEGDDISSLAHGQLEQHREYRHYARLAAWEMPLLTKMAKDFIPPTQKEFLRFRYTNYMGEQHPAEKKVVVEFCPADMQDLSDVQRDKLKKLAGSRWNPETDIVKMSCEMFETQAQNKRYLGDLVNTLLQEAKDPKDTFEDVPLDTRHHQFKVKPKFPVEWRMTDERRAELEASRQRIELAERQKAEQGGIMDGVQEIQAALSRPLAERETAAETQMEMAGKGGRKAGGGKASGGKASGKGKKVKLR